MADPASYAYPDREIEQALIALKKGTQLIKYSRQGKPKFCPFRVSPDFTTLIWYSRGSERNLKLSIVERIIPGQRTPVFRRFSRPEKEYLSFSLIYNGERSLDLICKDKAETEVWIAGLKTLTSTGLRGRRTRSDIPDLQNSESVSNGHRFGSALNFTRSIPRRRISVDLSCYPPSDVGSESAAMQGRLSNGDGFRLSVSSTPSCSSGGSGQEDLESYGDVFVWGEIWCDDISHDRYGNRIPIKADVLTPKVWESNEALEVLQISAGSRHLAVVTRVGLQTWGEESGGRLGHGIEKNYTRPADVEQLSIIDVEFVACGEYHTCAITSTGDLYTWGDGKYNAGLLGHGNDISHWIPKRVSGPLEGIQVFSVACGVWHSALVTVSGKLFTFGDGSFGVLGHGDRESVTYPKEVQLLGGLKTLKVSCGVWHTAAIVEVPNQSSPNVASKKLYTWGDGDKYRLGHGNKETYLLPTCVSALADYNIHQIACGYNTTAALVLSGHIFTMGSNSFGQLGIPDCDGKLPCLVVDKLHGEFVAEIACGAFHVAALTSRSELFTWGKGANGRLGHGDVEDRNVPTFVEALKDRHVKNITCGSKFTAVLSLHKWLPGTDQSNCNGCRQAFGFTRKRHRCSNCGNTFCHGCSSKKAPKSFNSTSGKPHRVCDACHVKLKNANEGSIAGSTLSRKGTAFHRPSDSIRSERIEHRVSRILLSPRTEPVKYLEVKSPSSGPRNDYSMVRASQVPSLTHLKDIAFPSSLSALQYALKPVMTPPPTPTPQPFPQPQSSSNSRPASPYSARRPSPPRAITPVLSRGVIDSLKKTNELLTQEVSKMTNQIKSLKQKSDLQEEEMEKLKDKVQDAASLAAERSSKCSEAVKIIKCIATQLKEVTGELPSDIQEKETFKSIQDEVDSFLENNGALESETYSSLPSTSHSAEGAAPSNAESRPSSPTAAAREVIEQFEPGVYVTLLQLTDGTKIFKRVKFRKCGNIDIELMKSAALRKYTVGVSVANSEMTCKRRFVEQQAEEWWKHNKDRLLKKYSTLKGSTTPAESSATSAAEPKVNSTLTEPSSGAAEASEEQNETAEEQNS